jgi:histidyl-tRNA synthetase
VIELIGELGCAPEAPAPDVYAIVPDASASAIAMATAQALREQGLAVTLHAAGAEGWGSMKSQFRRADASGARFALIFGAEEVAGGNVSVKPLRDAQASQVARPLNGIAQWAGELAAR